MSNPTLSGQDLLDQLRIRLGGLSNVYTVDQQLSFLNSAVTQVWAVIRSLDLDYFTDSSQDAQTGNDNYFADLNTATREYKLPIDCREIRSIECLSVGFEDRVFEYKRFSDPLFMQARREATASGANTGTNFSGIFNRYYYTVFGTQFVLAQYPEGALQVKIWFIKSLDAITPEAIPEILHPFNLKIVDYAAQVAILPTQNETLSAEWMQIWQEDVKTLALSAGARSSTNALFVDDYIGG